MAKAARSKTSHREPVSFGGIVNVGTVEEPAKPVPDKHTATPRRVYPGVHRTSVYIPNELHQLMRRVAFDMGCKEHDLIIEGLKLLLSTKHGMNV